MQLDLSTTTALVASRRATPSRERAPSSIDGRRAVELELADKLADTPSSPRSRQGRSARLHQPAEAPAQQRRGLPPHARRPRRSVARRPRETALQLADAARRARPTTTTSYGIDDDALEAAADAAARRRQPRARRAAEGRAREPPRRRCAASPSSTRTRPDAKVRALLAWIREHQCPAVADSAAPRQAPSAHWTDRRVIIFTEYGDTKRYLRRAPRRRRRGHRPRRRAHPAASTAA